MSDRPSDERRWEELNALVDGELDLSRVADVAARIADDPAVAREFATLAALKATTASLVPSAERGPARSWQNSAIAAALLLVLSAGLGALLLYSLQAPHERTTDVAALAPKALGLADDVTIGGIRLPNLEQGGLRLERAGVTHDGGKPRLEAAYVGERGCRVHLVVAHAADSERHTATTLPAQTTQWTVGAFVYTLTSERMDPQRFATVAQIAQSDTKAGPTRLAGAADLRNRPCLG